MQTTSIELLDRTTTSQPWLRSSVIFRCEIGSGLHGVALKDQDDHDELAIVVEPAVYVCGLRRFETVVLRTSAVGQRSGPGDVDLNVHSLRKFVRLALAGNPTIIQAFFVPSSKVYAQTVIGETLMAQRSRVVSRRALPAYLGYLCAQRGRLTGERGQKDVKRPELVERYGYDTKFAFHALRLGAQGVELLETGAITLPIPEPQRSHFLAVRRGEVTLADVLVEIGKYETRLRAEVETGIRSGPLPAEPDAAAVDEFLVDAHQAMWRGWPIKRAPESEYRIAGDPG